MGALEDKINELQALSEKVVNMRGPVRAQARKIRAILNTIINELNPGDENSLVSLLEAGDLQLDLPITSENIADGAITTEKIADGAIATEKIADAAIIANHIKISSGDIIISGTDTTGTIETEYNTSDSLQPIFLSCYPTAYDDGATIGYVQKVTQGTSGENKVTFTIELSAAPGETKSVTYKVYYLAVATA